MKLRTRWSIIGLVTIGTVLNYLARSTLSVAVPALRASFSLSTREYSWVVAAFQGAYTVMQPLAGHLLDQLGLRLGFALFAIAWSVTNMLHVFAESWLSLAVLRSALGVFEAAAIPAGVKAVAEWFPPRQRTMATGWFNIGTSVGAMIAPPVVVACIAIWGWHSAFVVTGGVGLIWAAIWYAVYRTPSPADRDGEGISSEAIEDARGSIASWRDIVRTRAFWAIALPRLFADPAWHTLSFFMPLYLTEARGMDLKGVAMFAWLPFLAADLGSVLGGYYAPWLMRRFGVPLLASRRIVVATGALLMVGMAGVGLTVSPYAAIALFCVGGFAHQMVSGALITLSADLFHNRIVGTVSGMAGAVAWFGAMGFSLLVGLVVPVFGYNPIFAVLAVFDLAATAILWLLLRPASGRAAVA